MHLKLMISLILVNLLLVTSVPVSLNAGELDWWDDSWTYRTKLIIPFDTNSPIAKYQPIDTIVNFDNPCWAKNEKEHSIRVIFQYKDKASELESQIYELNYVDKTHIKSCSIIFIIPNDACGNETYYIYYDNFEKPSPDYIDHVDIEESYYRYEPISGYPLTSQYYKIIQDGFIPYAISLEGEIMGYYTSQHVTKLKDGTTEVMPKNGELFAAFNFRYYYGQGLFDSSTTSQYLKSKEIIIDGNLMVEFGIVSTSENNDAQTTAIYKYYYCPSEDKRIHAHVIHEALQNLIVDENINMDGVFAAIQSGGISSSTISDLNIGKIMPFLHIYTEYDTIEEYPLDLDPDYIPDDPDIRILSTEDDVDLGEEPWACFDYGEKGVSHAIIFSSNKVLKSGTDELDGVQIKASEMDYPHLPGIENNMATVIFGRNSYELGGIHDRFIPNDFVVEFDAEFFSSKNGGYKIVSKETEIFQNLVEIKPLYVSEIDKNSDDIKRYNLTVFAHLSQSFPMGSAFSALLGRNFSYINAELYKDDEFILSGAMGRLLLKPLPDLSDKRKIGQVISVLSSFDYRNLTFVKKICFQNLEPGRYVVKIFKENQLFGYDRKFIGFGVIDISKDTKTRIFCRMQGSLEINVFDQNNNPVSNANVVLFQDNESIFDCLTNNDGKASIKVPIGFNNKYSLNIIYNGISVFSDDVHVGIFNSIFPVDLNIDIQRYDFSVNVFDTWDLIPEIKLSPKLINSADGQENAIMPSNQIKGQYQFRNLTTENYQLLIQYKSFKFEKDISIPSDDIKIVFPAEFNINIDTMDSRGMPLSNVRIVLSRFGKEFVINTDDSNTYFSLPPGSYNVKIYNKNSLIGSRSIDVFSERSFDIITKTEPIYPIIFTIFAIILALFGFFIYFSKKDFIIFLKLISISLLLVAIISPWWMLNGSGLNINTQTNMYLIPTNLVTTTTTDQVISGELAFIPQILTDAVSIILILTIFSSLILILSIFLNKKYKKISGILLFIAVFAFIVAIIIFSVGMNELAKVGIGSFIGERYLDISIPGEEYTANIICNWSPSIGFYLYILAILIVSLIMIYNIIYNIINNFKRIT